MMIKTVHSSGDGEVGGGGGNCMMLLVLLLLLLLHQLFIEHNNNSNRKPNFLFVVITFSSLVLFCILLQPLHNYDTIVETPMMLLLLFKYGQLACLLSQSNRIIRISPQKRCFVYF